MCKTFDIGCWLASFFSAVSEFFQTILIGMVTGLIAILDLLPLPFTAADITAAAQNLPDGVYYWMDVLQVPYGFTVIVTAYMARFIVRRLPVIG